MRFIFRTDTICERKSSAFGDEPRRMLRNVQSFDKHCSSHPQGEYVLIDNSGQPHIGQAVSDSRPTNTHLPCGCQLQCLLKR
jgi:hypothetical protein